MSGVNNQTQQTVNNQEPRDIEQIFNSKTQRIEADHSNDIIDNNSPYLPQGNSLVDISIREIDKLIGNNVNIDSYDEFKLKLKNKYSDENKELVKHLYCNDVLEKIFRQINQDNHGNVYFKNQQDYQKLVDYLQRKAVKLIEDKNNNNPELNNSRGGGSNNFGKYINLQLDIKAEGKSDNNYVSKAIIYNNTNLSNTYDDYTGTIKTPLCVSVLCNLDASDNFNCSIDCVNKKKTIEEINKLGEKYKEKSKENSKTVYVVFLVILSVLLVGLAIMAAIYGYKYNKQKKEEEEAKKGEALDDHTNIKSKEDTTIKYAKGTNVTKTGKDSNGNKTSVVTDVNDIQYGKDLKVNGQLKNATELVAAGEVKNITANGKKYDVLNIDVTKGTNGGADKYNLTLTDGTTKIFNQDQISSVKIGSKEYVGCLDTMENIDVQRSGKNTYFYYNTNDLEANLTTNNPTVTAYDANGAAMISTNATSEAGLSMLQQIYDDNPGVQYNARLNTLLGQDWYDKNGYLHDYKTGDLVYNYKDRKIDITDNINNKISSYYSGQTQRNSADHTNYGATEKYNDFTSKYGSNYANKIENSGYSLYDDITSTASSNINATFSLNSTHVNRANCLFA